MDVFWGKGRIDLNRFREGLDRFLEWYHRKGTGRRKNKTGTNLGKISIIKAHVYQDVKVTLRWETGIQRGHDGFTQSYHTKGTWIACARERQI